MVVETQDFETFLKGRFGGKLMKGAHSPDGKACINEALNAWRGLPWSDSGYELDLRGLNDAPWSSDAARTKAMLPLGPIILDWPNWTPERRQAWAKAVAEGVIRRILPPTLRAVAEAIPAKAPELVAAALRCETEGGESAAESAAESASASAESAESAAESAAWSAWSAAESAAESAESARAAESAAESAAWSAWSAAESAAESAAWSASRSAADAPLQELAWIMVGAALGDSR